VRVKYICDYCETVFSEEEFSDGESGLETDSLTMNAERDIIEQSEGETEIYRSFTCDECNKDLGLDEAADLGFLGRPVIN